MGNLSTHFDREEFGCRHCGKVKVADELVVRLERLRAEVGEPLVVVSGYRCPVHNAAVGGKARSQHLLGQAVDLRPTYARVSQAAHVGFTGIGQRNGWATHVDIRPKAARWSYA